ncbi:uncharacterized protein LOC103524346 [Diaphorina citri]|jgi:MtN3/saliva family.|uniref:Uncharacterized protein LOC103524346 n=1 Tax=Diaphorina citri TaxID=121845 RepID=A0A1S4ES82_DIACI|nr:uncharacterized protein LOC103524346 [Diaphorina citri]XP_026689194.1 uncharacterized protein LOC103524346 [Diaphorina citri]XP_026689198.1 uncharacterized protein LOC103524346 [Diaphorina citri]XP_026689202.1 uncharacterized protein LOC103524346 [Diaphorina citri]
MALEDYKDIVATACRVTTMAQAFSPVFMLLEVVKEGHTHNVDSTPFVGGLVMCTLALKHGLIMNDPVMLQVNMFTIVLNIIYFAVFYFYTVNKVRHSYPMRHFHNHQQNKSDSYSLFHP